MTDYDSYDDWWLDLEEPDPYDDVYGYPAWWDISDFPDHYQEMLERELDDDGTPDGGHSERQQRLTDLKHEFDQNWMWWKGDKPIGTHGTWVRNEAPWKQPDRKGRIIDRPDPELKHAYNYNGWGGHHFGGLRPSKRKSVK